MDRAVRRLGDRDVVGGLQDCATGTVPWSAQALVPPAKRTAPHAAYNVTITKATDGTVHFTVGH